MKKYYVVAGARLGCDQAPLPSFFFALNPGWNISGKGVGRLTDFIPFFNILPFGVPCKMLTQAAGGVPTPCIPFPLPWQGAHNSGRGLMLPVLLDTSSCRCAFGGKITVADAGQAVGSYDGPVLPEPPAPPLPTNIIVHRPDLNIDPTDKQAHTRQLAAAEAQINQPATLPPDTLFLVGNYLYTTDAQGRVVQAKGVLPPPPATAPRNDKAQGESVRYKDGLHNMTHVVDPRRKGEKQKKTKGQPNPTFVPDPRLAHEQREYLDDGGHIFASRFGGTPFHINYVPMHKNQNQSQAGASNWYAMEERQTEALMAGKRVYAEYGLEYPASGPPGANAYGGHKKTSARDFSMRPTRFVAKTWIEGKMMANPNPYPNA